MNSFEYGNKCGNIFLKLNFVLVIMFCVCCIFMKLDQFLKWLGLVETGGQAKHLVVSGQVGVNGVIETRRGRKLVEGDRISLAKNEYIFSNNQP